MTNGATEVGSAFREGFVEADGFRIRYLEAGEGEPLVMLHAAGGPGLSRAHDLLAQKHRVIAFETPGFGQSPVNERSRSMKDLALTMAQAASNLGLERYGLMGTSFGGKLALWQAAQMPEPIDALVLVAPAAVLPDGFAMPSTPEAMMRAMWAHPDQRPPMPPPDPAVVAKQNAFIARINGLVRDHELEAMLPEVNIPTLVLFGTKDGLIPPEMGRIYREKMPNCNFVLVYDAAHAIAAERPEALVSVVDDFLERKEAFVVSNQSTMINP
jgi:pimeloyl-ACP methyl ester carboxylesterase